MKDLTFKQAIFGIGLVAFTTLVFELVVNKALSFSTWGVLAYMVIGSAIFGYSIAGVVIAIWKPHEKYRLSRLLVYASIFYSLSIVLCYVIMNVVPFSFSGMLSRPINQIIYFTIWYLCLLIPFSLSGFMIAILLTTFRESSNRLYASDLTGAGFGCLLVVPLFPLLGVSGLYLLCAALGVGCVIVFAYGAIRKIAAGALLPMAALLLISPFAESIYPVKTHENKRDRDEHEVLSISV